MMQLALTIHLHLRMALQLIGRPWGSKRSFVVMADVPLKGKL